MPLNDAQSIHKLWHLVRQLPESEDPDACDDCKNGKHMDCIAEQGMEHLETGCTCEFCCGR